jgi:hypothetical protein
LVARVVWDHEVAGSSPVSPTKCPRSETDITTGFEPVSGGSNPSEGTKKIRGHRIVVNTSVFQTDNRSSTLLARSNVWARSSVGRAVAS